MSADTEQKKEPSAFSEEQADALSEKFTASWENEEGARPKPEPAPEAAPPEGEAAKPGGIPIKKTMLGLAPYSGPGPEPAAAAGPPAHQPASTSPFDAAAAALAATHPFPSAGPAAAAEPPTPSAPGPSAPSPSAADNSVAPVPAAAAPAPAEPATTAPVAIPRQRTLVGIQAPDDAELEKLAESFADAPDPVTRSVEPAPSAEPDIPIETAEPAPAAAETPAATPAPEYAPPSTPPASAGSQDHKTQGSVVVTSSEAQDASSVEHERVARQADTVPPMRPDPVAVEIPPEWGSTGSKKKHVLLALVAAALLGTVGLLAVLGGEDEGKSPETKPSESAAPAAAQPTPTASPETTGEAAPAESEEAAPDAQAEQAEEPAEAEEAPEQPKPPAQVAPKFKPKPRAVAPRATQPKPKRKATKPAKKKTTTTTKKKPSIVRETPF